MTQNEWDRVNTVVVTLKLNRKTDADILQYLEGKNKQGTIKDAIRTQIKEKSLPG